LPDAATLAGRCSKPGDCVTQLFWATTDGTQNYFYCKDTIVSGGASATPLPALTQGSSSSSGVNNTDIPTGATDAAPPPSTETGVTGPVDQPTGVEGPSSIVGSGVGDTGTPTDTEDAAVPTDVAAPATGDDGNDDDNDGESALQKLIDTIKGLFPNESPQASAPVEPPVAARRWMKEHY